MNFRQHILRNGIAPLLVSLGVHRLLLANAGHAAILMFHGVTARPGKTVRHMQTDEFVKLLKLIRREFEVVSLDTLINTPVLKKSRPRVALTFDDGYLNNFTEACPILAEMNLPATFFLITESLESDVFTLPIDTIDCIIEKYCPEEIVLDDIAFRAFDGVYRCPGNNENIFDYIIRKSDRMHDFSAQLKKQFDYDFLNDPYYSVRVRYIDRVTLTAIAQNPLFTFGSHTRTHVNCAQYAPDALAEQFAGSKKSIEELTGKPCIDIAYPYGLYDEQTRKLTDSIGYSRAFAVAYQLAQDMGDTTIFQRIGISNTTSPHVNLLHLSKLFGKRCVKLPVVKVGPGK